MEGQVLPAYSKEQKAAAYAAIAVVDELADRCGAFVDGLETNFVRLGQALHEVKVNEHWMVVGYSSFPTYIKSAVEPRVKRKRAILYAYMGAAEELLPYVSEDELTAIGITKAMALRKMISNGKAPSQQLLAKATDKEVKLYELQAAIAEESQIIEPGKEPVKYLDLGAIPLTKEESEEFMHCVNLTLQQDPPINIGGPAETWNDLPPFAKKEVLWRWIASVIVELMAELRGSGLSLRQTERSSGSSEVSAPQSNPERGSSSSKRRKRSKNSAGTSSVPVTVSANDVVAG